MNFEQRNCLLRFSSFIGDYRTVKCLLYDTDWNQNYINESLKLASIHGHIKTVEEILQDKRADLNFEDGICVSSAALQNHDVIVSLLLEAGARVTDAVSVAIWNIHQDQVNTFKEIWFYDNSIANKTFLFNAIRIKAYSCIDFIILNFFGKKDTSIIDLCLDLNWTDDLIIRLIKEGFPCSGKALKQSKNREKISKLVRSSNVKRRWMQVKSVLLLNSFWRNFCYDYYSPGNSNFPPGKGFLKAQSEFKNNSN